MSRSIQIRNDLIDKIDMDKYIVIKKDDLRYLPIDLKASISQIVAHISHKRKVIDNKPSNKYLVLNMDDTISLDYLGDNLFGDEFDEEQEIQIKDIAVTLVNAILKG